MVEFWGFSCSVAEEDSVLLVYDTTLWAIASWNFKAIQRPHLHRQRCPRTLHGPLSKMTVLTISKPSSVNNININDASLPDPFFVLKQNDRTDDVRISLKRTSYAVWPVCAKKKFLCQIKICIQSENTKCMHKKANLRGNFRSIGSSYVNKHT
jgi:hypothetical protein